MKTSESIVLIALLAIASFAGVLMGCNDNKYARDYEYEQYCDSVYQANPDYYIDVIEETDEYKSYIDRHGEWWNE